jgi:hypothetical protein
MGTIKYQTIQQPFGLPAHPSSKKKKNLGLLGASLRNSLTKSPSPSHSFAVRSFICKLVSVVEWIIVVEVLEPPLLFFFFLGIFWVCWEVFEGLVV